MNKTIHFKKHLIEKIEKLVEKYGGNFNKLTNVIISEGLKSLETKSDSDIINLILRG